MEHDELKQYSIELMRGWSFDMNSIDETEPVSEISMDRVDGNRNVNLFFEKSFEWPEGSPQVRHDPRLTRSRCCQ